MSRILVTGATGFVGRHLCDALVEKGFSVVGTVRQDSSTEGLPRGMELTAVGDIGPNTCWEPKHFDGVDTVIHLAVRVHVMKDKAADPAAEFYHTNVLGTEKLARAAAGRVRRFIYVSSLHAMRSLSDTVLNEQSACNPDSPYGRSKLLAEQMLQLIRRETGLDVVTVRPPPVYGPGGIGNLMSLLRWVGRGWPLPVGGIANQRSMVYVGNLASALMECITHPHAGGHTFLVSDGEALSISEFFQRACTAFRRPARLLPAPTSLMRWTGRLVGKSSAVERLLGSLAVDISNIRQVLGWRPLYSLDESLGFTGTWFESIR